MSNVLTKNTSITIGSWGTIIVPGVPGHPAYCIWVTETVPVYRMVVTGPDHDGVYHYVLVQDGTADVVFEHCYPALPAVPPYLLRIPNYVVDYNFGWDAGAISIDTLTGSGVFSFSVDTSSIGIVAGFNQVNVGASYTEIDSGIYTNDTRFQIMERGVAKTPQLVFAASDVFSIVRLGTQVSYYINDTKIYTSTMPLAGTIFADCSLFAGNDNIVDASIGSTIDPDLAAIGTPGYFDPPFPVQTTAPPVPPGELPAFVSSHGSLTALRGDGLAGLTSAGRGTLSTLSGSAESYPSGSVDGELVADGGVGSLFGNAYGSAGAGTAYATASPRLPALRGSIEGGSGTGTLIPDHAVCDGFLGMVGGFSTALAGMLGTVIDVPIGALRGNGIGGAGAGITGAVGFVDHGYLRGLLGDGIGGDDEFLITAGVIQAVPKGPSGYLYAENDAPSEQPPELTTLTGNGILRPAAAVLTGTRAGAGALVPESGPLVQGTRAGAGVLVAAGPLVTGAGTQAQIGNGLLRPSAAFVMGSALNTQFGVGILRPRHKAMVVGYGAGYGILAPTSRPLVAGSAWAIEPGVGLLEPAAAAVTGAGWVGNGGIGLLLSTSRPIIVQGGRGLLTPTGPTVFGVTVQAVGEHEGYSITFLPDGTATTRLTNFPFDQVVRWQGKHYGISSDAVYELTGDAFGVDDDDLDVPIVADIKTAFDNFGTPSLKRPRAAFMSGEAGADFAVAVQVSGRRENANWNTVDAPGNRPHRIKLPRGETGEFLAYRLSNLDGEFFRIAALTPENDNLRRVLGGSRDGHPIEDVG